MSGPPPRLPTPNLPGGGGSGAARRPTGSTPAAHAKSNPRTLGLANVLAVHPLAGLDAAFARHMQADVGDATNLLGALACMAETSSVNDVPERVAVWRRHVARRDVLVAQMRHAYEQTGGYELVNPMSRHRYADVFTAALADAFAAYPPYGALIGPNAITAMLMVGQSARTLLPADDEGVAAWNQPTHIDLSRAMEARMRSARRAGGLAAAVELDTIDAAITNMLQSGMSDRPCGWQLLLYNVSSNFEVPIGDDGAFGIRASATSAPLDRTAIVSEVLDSAAECLTLETSITRAYSTVMRQVGSSSAAVAPATATAADPRTPIGPTRCRTAIVNALRRAYVRSTLRAVGVGVAAVNSDDLRRRVTKFAQMCRGRPEAIVRQLIGPLIERMLTLPGATADILRTAVLVMTRAFAESNALGGDAGGDAFSPLIVFLEPTAFASLCAWSGVTRALIGTDVPAVVRAVVEILARVQGAYAAVGGGTVAADDIGESAAANLTTIRAYLAAAAPSSAMVRMWVTGGPVVGRAFVRMHASPARVLLAQLGHSGHAAAAIALAGLDADADAAVVTRAVDLLDACTDASPPNAYATAMRFLTDAPVTVHRASVVSAFGRVVGGSTDAPPSDVATPIWVAITRAATDHMVRPPTTAAHANGGGSNKRPRLGASFEMSDHDEELRQHTLSELYEQQQLADSLYGYANDDDEW
jgi:hypothetical protein